MKTLPGFDSIQSTEMYDGFLNAMYMKALRRVEEIEIPPVQAICVTGNQAPASKQFQDAIAVLYGIGYGLKMGLKFGKLPKPSGYFDYKVGALETFWWSDIGEFDISNQENLHWQAYLMVTSFVTTELIDQARTQAKSKHPELQYELAMLDTICEGRSIQALHVGPYDKEQPTIDLLKAFAADHGLFITGKHHEIYISDPRRTAPDKLKTVIRYAVKP